VLKHGGKYSSTVRVYVLTGIVEITDSKSEFCLYYGAIGS
jgi:hypothetical protein